MASYDDVAYVVTVPSSVSGVIFDGLMVNGDNPLTTSPFTANGANPDADEGISITGDGAIVRNCVVKNIFQFGISMGATSAASARFGEVTDNYLENIPYWAAILAYDSYYAEVSGNTIVNAWRGVQADNHYLAVPEGQTASISNNTITTGIQAITGDSIYEDYDGILHNLQYGASVWTIANNSITNTSLLNTNGDSDGIEVWSILDAATVSITGNTIANFPNGYTLWHCPATAGVTVSGGSVSGAINGVVATNHDNFGSATSSSYTISGVAIAASTAGVVVNDSALNDNGASVTLALTGGSISGGATGLSVSGADATVTLGATAFTGQSGNHIALVGNANAIDATTATFGGNTGAAATLAQNFDIEDKISHKLDDSALGLVRVKSSNVFVASSGNIGRGVSAASTGDTVNIAAGSFIENITLDKRVALVGAGSSEAGTVLSSSTTATPVIRVTGSGLDALNQLTIAGVRLSGAANASGSDGIAVYGDTPVSFVKVDGIHATGYGQGVHYRSGTISNVTVANSTFHANNFGVRVATAVASMNGMTIDGCAMYEQTSSAISTNPSGSQAVVNTNFTVSNSTFTNNSRAGVTNQHDLSFFGFHGNATLSNVTMTSGNGVAQNSNSYGILFTNGVGRAALGTVSLSNVTVQGHVGKGALSFQLYNELGGLSLSNVSLQNCVAPWGDLIVDSSDADAMNAGNTLLKSVVLWFTGGVNAESASYYTAGGSLLDRAVLADNFQISNQSVDVIDTAGLGLVRFAANKIYVSAASAAGAFDRAIAASVDGDTLYIQDGTAFVLTTEITKSILFSGNFAITAANIPTGASATAVLSSFIAHGAVGSVYSAVTTGMSADQLNAIASNYAAFNGGVTGDITLTASQSAAQITAILGGAADGSIYAVATGMGDAQLNAIAGNAGKIATDGITGTMLVTAAITDANLAALLFKASILGATVEVNGFGMADSELSSVALADARVDELYNLLLSSGQTGGEITTLLGKSVASASAGKEMALANATSMVATQLNALGDSQAKLAADGVIGSIVLTSGVTDANFTNLFGKIAMIPDVRINGTGLGASTITIVNSNIAKVDSAFAMFVTNSQTIAELDGVLGVSDDSSASANATGMDSAAGGKLATLADNSTKFVAGGISGSFTITADLTAIQIANLLSKVDFGAGGSSFLPPASVTVDASGMSSAQLSTIATSVASAGSSANQAAVFDITNLSLSDGQTSEELAVLLNSTLANEATVNATGMDAAQLAALGNAPTAVDQITGSITITADLTAEQIAAIMGNTATSAQVTIDSTGMSPEQQDAVLSTAVLVVSAEATVATGDMFSVDVDLSGLASAAVGMQARIGFDASQIEFVADADGDTFADSIGGIDMPTTIFVSVGASSISFATGVDTAGSGEGITTGNAAHLTFRALVPFCGMTDLVWLIPSDGSFTNRVTDGNALAIPFIGTNFSSVTSLNDLQLAGVPSGDISEAADAGTTAGAAIAEPTVTASNNCAPSVPVGYTITYPNATTSSTWPARFPVGVSSVTWTATDDGGNVASDTRTYTVANYQLATIDVNLIGSINPAIVFDQVVRIRLSSGDVVSATVPFTGNNGALVDVQVPVRNDYTCITVKDAGHTVADAQTLSVSGVKYAASGSFELVSGDSNDDNLVDILDFGAFISDRGAGKTPASRSNFDRNFVVNNSDFSFISLNFLAMGDNCAGGNFDGGAPLTRVTVKELRRAGLGYLEEADINMDGWLDTADMALAMQGQFRPDAVHRLDANDEAPMTNW